MNTPEELDRLSRKMNELLKQGKLAERNALVDRWRELYQNCDFGFRVGDRVLCPIVKKNRVFTITKITDDNYFQLDGRDLVPGNALEKYKPEPEQLSFEF